MIIYKDTPINDEGIGYIISYDYDTKIYSLYQLPNVNELNNLKTNLKTIQNAINHLIKNDTDVQRALSLGKNNTVNINKVIHLLANHDAAGDIIFNKLENPAAIKNYGKNNTLLDTAKQVLEQFQNEKDDDSCRFTLIKKTKNNTSMNSTTSTSTRNNSDSISEEDMDIE